MVLQFRHAEGVFIDVSIPESASEDVRQLALDLLRRFIGVEPATATGEAAADEGKG